MIAWKLMKGTFQEFFEDECLRMAAALSYYTLFSLAPLLVFVIAIAGLMLDPGDVQGEIRYQIEQVVGRDGADQIEGMVSAASKPRQGMLATTIGSAVLLFGAISLVGQLQASMNTAWGVKPAPNVNAFKHFLMSRILSFTMVLGAGFLLLVSLLTSAAISSFGNWIGRQLPGDTSQPLLMAINVIISVLVISVLFAAMFKFLPDAKVAWSDVIAGALFTALLFVAGKSLMGLYLGSKNMDSAYGAAGSIALILLWVYYSSIIFLFGAEFTQVWARQLGSGVKPVRGSVIVDKVSVSERSRVCQDSGRLFHSES